MFGSETNTLPAGNFFLSRETAEIFAAASPFASIPMKTEGRVLSSSQEVSSTLMDIQPRKVSVST